MPFWDTLPDRPVRGADVRALISIEADVQVYARQSEKDGGYERLYLVRQHSLMQLDYVDTAGWERRKHWTRDNEDAETAVKKLDSHDDWIPIAGKHSIDTDDDSSPGTWERSIKQAKKQFDLQNGNIVTKDVTFHADPDNVTPSENDFDSSFSTIDSVEVARDDDPSSEMFGVPVFESDPKVEVENNLSTADVGELELPDWKAGRRYGLGNTDTPYEPYKEFGKMSADDVTGHSVISTDVIEKLAKLNTSLKESSETLAKNLSVGFKPDDSQDSESDDE